MGAAPAARRTVVVAQTSCPRCTIYGAQEVNHEASFPYADPGARCSDVIDGSTATKCYKSAVDGAPDLTTAVDCGSGMVQTDTTGTYKIEYRAKTLSASGMTTLIAAVAPLATAARS